MGSLRKVLALLGVAIGILVLGACFGTDVGDGSSVPPITPSLLAAMPETQAEILADGSVSSSEFERAVLGLVSCLESSGLEVMNVDIDGTGWSLGYKSGFDGPTRDEAAYEECYGTHVEHVEVYYLAEREPTAAEREAERVTMVECLQEADVEVRDDADWGEIQAATPQDFDAWARCIEVATERTPS